MKKTTLLVLTLLIMTVVLSACGPGRQKAAPDAGTGASSKAASDVVRDIKAYDSDGTSVEFRNLDISAVSTNGGTLTLLKEGDGYYAKAE